MYSLSKNHTRQYFTQMPKNVTPLYILYTSVHVHKYTNVLSLLAQRKRRGQLKQKLELLAKFEQVEKVKVS